MQYNYVIFTFLLFQSLLDDTQYLETNFQVYKCNENFVSILTEITEIVDYVIRIAIHTLYQFFIHGGYLVITF